MGRQAKSFRSRRYNVEGGSIETDQISTYVYCAGAIQRSSMLDCAAAAVACQLAARHTTVRASLTILTIFKPKCTNEKVRALHGGQKFSEIKSGDS